MSKDTKKTTNDSPIKDRTYLDKLKLKYLPPGEKDLTLEQINELIAKKDFPSAEYTLAEIGYLCGISRERVRQIEMGAIRKIKNVLAQPSHRLLRRDIEEARDHLLFSSDNGVNEMFNQIHTNLNK